MFINAPDQLHSKYVRAMMAWLLFKEQPGNVLMIGVGGGLLSKYLLYQFPYCRIQGGIDKHAALPWISSKV
jgi:spermidine synthase